MNSNILFEKKRWNWVENLNKHKKDIKKNYDDLANEMYRYIHWKLEMNENIENKRFILDAYFGSPSLKDINKNYPEMIIDIENELNKIWGRENLLERIDKKINEDTLDDVKERLMKLACKLDEYKSSNKKVDEWLTKLSRYITSIYFSKNISEQVQVLKKLLMLEKKKVV